MDSKHARINLCIHLGILLVAGSLTCAKAAAGGPTLQTLHILKGVSDGGQPWAAPIFDQAGNLYGTTSEGGDGLCRVGRLALGCGTVYELSPAGGTKWNETVLYQFHDAADGTIPQGGLVFDNAGNLYGTTEQGGAHACGTVFELSPPASGQTAWTKTTILDFDCNSQGYLPQSTLIFDKAGNLYGTTALGGGSCTFSVLGCGIVFKLSPPSTAGEQWSETVLYAFQGGPDGVEPQGQLVFDATGNLYGTTILGGIETFCTPGCGTAFELSPPSSPGGTWTEKVLYAFTDQNGDGFEPRSGVVFGKSGALYGTASGGANSFGAIFQLTPPTSASGAWAESIVYSFTNTNDGEGPFGPLVMGGNGIFYGTTTNGGSLARGNVFKLTPPATAGDSWVATQLSEFSSFAYPIAGLTFGKSGWLYGATLGGVVGGTCSTNLSTHAQMLGCGTIFRILP